MGSCKNNDSGSRLLQSLISLSNPKYPVPIETRREEAKIETEIIKAITSGKSESLKPNSGQAITIGNNYICVSFHDETDPDCRVWEWHGHVVFYDEVSGYKQEYVNGNYFERLTKNVSYVITEDELEEQWEQEMEIGFGLGEFIGGMNLLDERVLCRNFRDNARRF